MLCAYVAGLVAITSYKLITDAVTGKNLDLLGNLGAELAGMILIILNIVSSATVFLFTYASSKDEGNHHEMMFATPLTEIEMGIGKTLAAVVLTMLFYATTMPFLTIAWILGGVDLRLLLTLLICSFLCTQTVNIYLAAALFHRPGFEHIGATYFSLLVVLPVLLSVLSVMGGVSVFFTSIHSSHTEFCFLRLFWSTLTTLVFYFVAMDLFRVNVSRCSAAERFCNNVFSAYAAGFFICFGGGALFALLYGVWIALKYF